jgi:predicted Zn-dependent peptidase
VDDGEELAARRSRESVKPAVRKCDIILDLLEMTINKEVLENGLTILTEQIEPWRSISLGIWLKKGSRDETPREAGIYHFIEHMVFKGTNKRNAYEVAKIMDSIGGFNDAFTSKENTCFYAKVLDEHLPIILDLFADILIDPKFEDEDIERERKVIHEEIKMVEDTPGDIIHELFLENFWPDHPLGRPILGTTDTVNAVNRKKLKEQFALNYVPHNMVVSAAGNIRHEDLVASIRNLFRLKRNGSAVSDAKYTPAVPRPMVVLRSKKDLEQAHVVLGMMGYDTEHPDRYAAGVMNVILGGSMSSRLFQRIREERGLCYTVYSSMNSFRECGYVNIYAGTARDTIRTAAELILKECRLLAKEEVTPDELENAKNHLKGGMILSLESSSNRMFTLARNEIYHGRQISVDETLEHINAVTQDDVKRVAADLFQHEDYGIVALGDLEDLDLREDDLKAL